MSTYVRLSRPALGFNAGQVVLITDDAQAQTIVNGGSGVATVQWSFNQFMNRFTGPEQAAMATGARTSAQIFLFFTLGAGSNSIDPTDPAVKAGLDGMVTAGYITQTRENTILDPNAASP